MSVEPIKGARGEKLARATCDDCGTTYEFRAAHGPSTKFIKTGRCSTRGVLTLAKLSQVSTKLENAGWQSIRKKNLCPSCVIARKAENETDQPTETKSMDTTVTKMKPAVAKEQAPRQPTREQKREIMGMLDVSYDTKLGRYKGSDTDKTVAEVLGQGILSGWVAEIRKEFFGEDGGNGEIDALSAEVATMVQQIEKHEQAALAAAAEARKHAEAASRIGDNARSLGTRIDRIKEAVGPRAAKA
ncbi:hypothetical protein [Roseicitreum antarcticum]|uniref:Uncharacterized protein n=1 Tax=Roseicitreum antarcticum TaxID=564137 RepID=A0A1H3E489_9RHOB|nr:hypothetical protein [Roseicitreum antarcticum]SDX73486.1 hypothetical protein SAMN04488238_1182 [Roseicitreum antarcticum]